MATPHDDVDTGSNPDREFGEGNYKAAQNFRKGQEAFAADDERVAKKAREAADALDGPEAVDLKEAEAAARDGQSA